MSETKDFYCDFVLSDKVAVEKVKETDRVLAFYHTKPSWSTHIVLIPKEHVPRLADLSDMTLAQEILEVARQIILDMKLHESNYKIITNGGSFQDSQHLHFHLVSGKNTKALPTGARE